MLGLAMLLICVGACSTRSTTTRCNGLKCLGPISPPSTLSLVQQKTHFQQIVNRDPTNRYGWYNLGVIAQNAKDTKAAAQDFNKAIAIDPHFESPLYQLGLLYFQANDLPDAITYLGRAVAANPMDANAHWQLGLALAHTHMAADSRHAVQELNAALRINPRLGPHNLFNLPTSTSRSAP